MALAKQSSPIACDSKDRETGSPPSKTASMCMVAANSRKHSQHAKIVSVRAAPVCCGSAALSGSQRAPMTTSERAQDRGGCKYAFGPGWLRCKQILMSHAPERQKICSIRSLHLTCSSWNYSPASYCGVAAPVPQTHSPHLHTLVLGSLQLRSAEGLPQPFRWSPLSWDTCQRLYFPHAPSRFSTGMAAGSDAAAVPDQKTLALVNTYVVSVARMLNDFSSACEDSLSKVIRRDLLAVIYRDVASCCCVEDQLHMCCEYNHADRSCRKA